MLGKHTAADRTTLILARKRAMPGDVEWVQAALNDSSTDVRFEALRWLADRNMNHFADHVAGMLADPKLDFRLFEACLAAHNTLAGNPRAGIAEPKLLATTIQSPDTPDEIKAYALRLLPPSNKNLNRKLLNKLLQSDNERLLKETIRTIAAVGPKRFQDALVAVASSSDQPIQVRTEALAAMASDAGAFKAELLALAKDTNPQIQAEALRSLRFSNLDASTLGKLKQTLAATNAELLRAIEQGGKLKVGRPPVADTESWLRLIGTADEQRGDPVAGERIFYHARIAMCSSCHRHHGRGSIVGPDLTAVGTTGDRLRMLKAILEPSRDVDPQFHPRTLVLSSGKTFTGIMLRKGGRSGREFYRDDKGREQSFSWSEIESRTDLTTSLMPAGLVDTMTVAELRDLLAFLQHGSR